MLGIATFVSHPVNLWESFINILGKSILVFVHSCMVAPKTSIHNVHTHTHTHTHTILKCYLSLIHLQHYSKFLQSSSSFILFCINTKFKPFSNTLILALDIVLLLKLNILSEAKYRVQISVF